MALLTARDPILFYAEVPLYESELDDNGSSQLSVKVTTSVRLQGQEMGLRRDSAVSVQCWSHLAGAVVQVRVMPGCWYVLLRFFLRVDSTLVRLRETRLFCDLKEPHKVRAAATSPLWFNALTHMPLHSSVQATRHTIHHRRTQNLRCVAILTCTAGRLEQLHFFDLR